MLVIDTNGHQQYRLVQVIHCWPVFVLAGMVWLVPWVCDSAGTIGALCFWYLWSCAWFILTSCEPPTVCSLTRQTKNCKSFLKVASSDLGCVTQLWLKDPSLPTAQLFDVSRIHSCSEHSTWSLIDHVLGNNKQADILKKYIPCEFIPFPYI